MKLKIQIKVLGSNIKAPIAGVVTYKVDLLENEIEFDKVLNYDVSKLDQIIKKYGESNSNNFGIKIVDNFQCYFLTREVEDENSKYIKEGKNYKIKLINKSSEDTCTSTLVKTVKANGYIYNIFSINENIEDIVDAREIGAEIIWTKEEGLSVPLSAMINKNGISYVTLISGGEYIEVPIKIIISNDTIGIVDNYTEEELTGLGITSSSKIKRYDQIVINDEK